MVVKKLSVNDVYKALEEVPDPEIPVINIIEMGIIRNIEEKEGFWTLSITPTYSGCPAMKAIEEDIAEVLIEIGVDNFKIKTILNPAWTTEWISDEACEKLRKYGIAPPNKFTQDKSALTANQKEVACPQCKSTNTEMSSQFGSTACKSLYKCLDCLEPFDYFKCI